MKWVPKRKSIELSWKALIKEDNRLRDHLRAHGATNILAFLRHARRPLSVFARSGCDLELLADSTAEYRALVLLESARKGPRESWAKSRNLNQREKAFVQHWTAHAASFLEKERRIEQELLRFEKLLRCVVAQYEVLQGIDPDDLSEIVSQLIWGEYSQVVGSIVQDWLKLFEFGSTRGGRGTNDIKFVQRCVLFNLVTYLVQHCGKPCWHHLSDLICAWDVELGDSAERRIEATPEGLRVAFARTRRRLPRSTLPKEFIDLVDEAWNVMAGSGPFVVEKKAAKRSNN